MAASLCSYFGYMCGKITANFLRIVHGRYYLLILFLLVLVGVADAGCRESECYGGYCFKGECVCYSGWTGNNCQYCSGRILLDANEGYIVDGPSNYTTSTKCTWLIDSGRVNATVQLNIQDFATECSWDNVYIYDGDSIYDKQVAALSGMLVPSSNHNHNDYLGVTLRSGVGFIHFFSDAAYNMTGFNISYSVGRCPNDCSDHGICDVYLQCICDYGWAGEACEKTVCPNDCGEYGRCRDGKCVCLTDDYRGIDCSVPLTDGYWERDETGVFTGAASPAAVAVDNSMWIMGGYTFNQGKELPIRKYDMLHHVWEIDIVSTSNSPKPRYGHTAIAFGNSILVYGGTVSGDIVNELWTFDIQTHTWTYHNATTNVEAQLAVTGHTANIIGDVMIIIFGFSPYYGFLNKVQEYNIVMRRWEVVETSGAPVKGLFGHTSVYHPETHLIYVHGGLYSTSMSASSISDELLSYSPMTKCWTTMQKSVFPRYLHSAVIIGEAMIVFGGNTHNDTSSSEGAACYSQELLAYDIICGMWEILSEPLLYEDVSRFGHTAVLFNKSMLIYGGFRARELSDVLIYTNGDCTVFSTRSACSAASPGLFCYWTGWSCQSTPTNEKRECSPSVDPSTVCKDFMNCGSCMSNIYGCTWCDGKCAKICRHKNDVLQYRECPSASLGECTGLYTCQSCHQQQQCEWSHSDHECKLTDSGAVGNIGTTVIDGNCQPPCSKHMTCDSCVDTSCMWCSSSNKCVDSNAYVAAFPFGQCMEWHQQGPCPAPNCTAIRLCSECQLEPGCGWCDDGSQTGKGMCLPGGYEGPVKKQTSSEVDIYVRSNQCPNSRWYFFDCPACQCNGHSTCVNGSVCDSCQNLTSGDHCEMCVSGYYGNPTNGGTCAQCFCNGHGDKCKNTTGECYCSTKGVTGDHCELCDVRGDYIADPLTGTCFYGLNIDYEYTFNLSGDDDKYLTGINFMVQPKRADRDMKVNVAVSNPAYLNFSAIFSDDDQNNFHVAAFEFIHYQLYLSHEKYQFSPTENTTFFVYIYNFTAPLVIKISVTQSGAAIDLVQFFVTFFSCFISLLLVAAIFWKAKQRYDIYRRQQARRVELVQMASRPIKNIHVTFDVDMETNKKKLGLRPLAMEPLSSNKAAIMSVFLALPKISRDNNGSPYTGLAFGSTLVTLPENTNKSSSFESKGKGQAHSNRNRKHRNSGLSSPPLWV